MTEPLVIQFMADTSRAQSAMATLAAQIVGNMAQIGTAMTGGAANSNGFGAALEGLKSNAIKAAASVGSDVANIVTATATAATQERASLEGVVKAATGAAVASNTAGAATRAGLSATSGMISGLVAQIPSLGTLLTAFIAFEAVKLIFESVSASIDEARQHVEDFTRIAKEADRLGVGTTFFQRATLDAKALGLETRQVVAALEHARSVASLRIGEGPHGANGSPMSDRLEQNVRAGNLTAADRAAYDAAATQEGRIRVVLGLIDKLRDQGRELAAFDLAGKFFGDEFEAKLREGVDLTGRLRENLEGRGAVAGGQRIVDPEEIERATKLDAKLTDIRNTFATALIPIERDASNAALDIYAHILDVEQALGRAALVASHLYVELAKIPGALDAAVPSAGRLATLLGAVDLGKSLGIDGVGPKIKQTLADWTRKAGYGDAFGLPREGETEAQAESRHELDDAKNLLRERMKQPGAVPAAVEASDKLDFRPRPRDTASQVLPSLHPKGGEGAGAQADPVETYVHSLERAAAAAKAEAEAFGKSNAEKQTAIALAKAQEIASQNGTSLTEAQTAAVTRAAEATGRYRDRLQDLEQAQRQNADAALFFGQTLETAFEDAVLSGRSLNDVLSNLLRTLARAALQSAFTGQGPLAGLLGTAPNASAGPNAVGGIASFFNDSRGFDFGNLDPLPAHFAANGGPVTAGQPVTVGEMGRELFVPNVDGRIVPLGRGEGGGASVQAPVTIVMQGASGDHAADRAAADLTGKVAAQHVERVVMGVMQREMRSGGALYQAGLRRSG